MAGGRPLGSKNSAGHAAGGSRAGAGRKKLVRDTDNDSDSDPEPLENTGEHAPRTGGEFMTCAMSSTILILM
jgi:hypothetical protein